MSRRAQKRVACELPTARITLALGIQLLVLASSSTGMRLSFW